MNTLQNDSKIFCTRCVYESSLPGIYFDPDGVCNYCLQIEALKIQYGTGSDKGRHHFNSIIDSIKAKGKGKKYDCIVGVSGGVDSSYLLMKACDWGLRPLAVHYDNTWNTAIASANIYSVTTALGIDLYTHVVDNSEINDLKRALLLASVPEFDGDTDIALPQVMRSIAARVGTDFILEGHSFVAEGISPLGKNYFDGKYIEDIHHKFGNSKITTFPNLTFWQFMKWSLLYGQKFVRPFWYLEYSKSSAREELSRRTEWRNYQGHHMENRASAFFHQVWSPLKFGVDYRNLSIAADVRNNVIPRKEGLRKLRQKLEPDPELIRYLKKRLCLTDLEYEQIMHAENRSWHDFRTYKKRFERLRPLFHVLAKANKVPMSFYLKYCLPVKN